MVQKTKSVGISTALSSSQTALSIQFKGLTRQQATWSEQELRQVVEKGGMSAVRGARGGTENA